MNVGGAMKVAFLRARYRRIMFFFAGAAIDFLFWEVLLPRLGLRRLSQRTRPNRYRRIAAQFRGLAIKMGGVMIKVGQFLSSRLDVLPPEITSELAGLQDEVPPEDFENIRKLAEAELGAPLLEKYESFEEIPLAAASLGQVHRARLCVDDPEKKYCNVVVKVQRPFIDQLVETDLSALRQVGGWLQKYRPLSKRVDVPSLMEEFSTTVRAEVDYLAEGKNAEVFTENFKEDARVHVPKVVWSHTTRRVLTLEDVFAIKITDYEAISAAGIDRSEVAQVLLGTYLKQIFEDGFFHADPHPGNLFVTPTEGVPEDGKPAWRLTFVDFGMAGIVPDYLRKGLRETIIAMGTQDAARLIRAFQTLHVLLPGTDLQQLEQMSASIFDMLWGKSMEELRSLSVEEMMRFADRFRDLMYTMPFQLPQNLLILGRTVAILSGMCTGLDKDFNVWKEISPYATKLISEEGGSNWKVWLDELGNIAKDLIAMPGKFNRVLGQMERGDLMVQMPTVNRQITYLEKAINRLTASLVFVGFLLGGVILYNAENITVAMILFGFAAITLLWMVFGGRGNSRRFHP
jgi:predicted unusual protein kinase regulating ubiquinone biosynthesis (AarF/ABC1/UbiB family)